MNFAGFQRQMTPNGQTNGNGNGNSIRDPISPGSNEALDYKYGKFFHEMCTIAIKKIIFAGRFDASALHIAHALKQTEIQKSYNKAREKPIDEYLVSFSTILNV